MDKHGGELIGCVDLGDVSLDYAALSKIVEIATYVLVFLIRSILNPLKFSLANFATTRATATQMFPQLWKAVGAITCDGASPNRKLVKIHFHMTPREH